MYVAPSFASVQAQVRSIFHDRTVVGHTVLNDLHALQIFHPGYLLRDVSICPFLRPPESLPQPFDTPETAAVDGTHVTPQSKIAAMASEQRRLEKEREKKKHDKLAALLGDDADFLPFGHAKSQKGKKNKRGGGAAYDPISFYSSLYAPQRTKPIIQKEKEEERQRLFYRESLKSMTERLLGQHIQEGEHSSV